MAQISSEAQIRLLEDFVGRYPNQNRKLSDDECAAVTAWVGLRLDYEKDHGVGSVEEQRLWLSHLLRLSRDKKVGGTRSVARRTLEFWARQTENIFGWSYSEGYLDGNVNARFHTTRELTRKRKNEVKRKAGVATNRRKAIGDASRTRVKQAAMKHRHLSKETAAPLIAHEVGLSAGTVRRYLSQLYPGKSWYVSGDT